MMHAFNRQVEDPPPLIILKHFVGPRREFFRTNTSAKASFATIGNIWTGQSFSRRVMVRYSFGVRQFGLSSVASHAFPCMP
jgi:hypothetical protein